MARNKKSTKLVATILVSATLLIHRPKAIGSGRARAVFERASLLELPGTDQR
jgi:hypothetical protein